MTNSTIIKNTLNQFLYDIKNVDVREVMFYGGNSRNKNIDNMLNQINFLQYQLETAIKETLNYIDKSYPH